MDEEKTEYCSSGVELMAEREVVAAEQEHANKMFEEATELWNQTEGWSVVNSNEVEVEGRSVGGVFASSGLDVTRSSTVVEFDAHGLFNFLTSREGLRVMEPFAQEKGLFEPMMTLGFQPKGSMDIKQMERHMDFPYQSRQYLILSATDSSKWRIANKSILHDHVPGGSVYSECYAGSWMLPMCRPSTAPNHERAVQTMAFQVERERSTGNSVVKLLYFSDLCGSYPRYKMKQENISYHINFHRDLKKALEEFKNGI
mmetsp:Transcript_2435/g.3451  ORF Transcript_2435/g.3451 Transcript_2435/m.3451 type:complete len:257 (-) Transcript_2435:272-1042(-)